MSSVSLKIQILEKEYQVNCAPEEQEALQNSASLVNKKMEEIRKGSSIIGLERIAVMTALNLAHDVISGQDSKKQDVGASKIFNSLDSKITKALSDLNS